MACLDSLSLLYARFSINRDNFVGNVKHYKNKSLHESLFLVHSFALSHLRRFADHYGHFLREIERTFFTYARTQQFPNGSRKCLVSFSSLLYLQSADGLMDVTGGCIEYINKRLHGSRKKKKTGQIAVT